jgi:hypothetical protein
VKDPRIAKAKTATVLPVLRRPNGQNATPTRAQAHAKTKANAKNAAPVMQQKPKRRARTNAQPVVITATRVAVRAANAAPAATKAATLHRPTPPR